MNTISDYVKQRTDSNEYEIDEKISDLHRRADKHQAESERLMRTGDLRQAETHGNIARTHHRSANVLEATKSVHRVIKTAQC
jgi:hemerythrin